MGKKRKETFGVVVTQELTPLEETKKSTMQTEFMNNLQKREFNIQLPNCEIWETKNKTKKEENTTDFGVYSL